MVRFRNAFQRGLSTCLVITILASSSPLAVAPAAVHRDAPPPVTVTAAVAPPSAPDLAPSYDASTVVDDDPSRSDLGALMGRAVDGPTEQALPGVQVVAVGVLGLHALPIFMPMQMAGRRRTGGLSPASLPDAGATPLTETVIFTATTNATGDYLFDVPAGDYTLTYTVSGYTPDERQRPVRANEVLRVDDVRLHPQDPVVTELGSSGGTAANSTGNSNVQFPPGALAAQEDVRVTYVDNADLPDFFPDGSAPMGFSSFEPEGTVFPAGKEVLWTVAYTGTLPIGTDTLCYWWDGKEQRWRDPVPGKVVDLGNGKKALQAKVPHFSFYGHAVPGIAGQQPGQAGDATVIAANIGQGASAFSCHGCEINMGTGSVSESYAFNLVPSRGMPLALNIRYDTTNDTPFVFASVPFTITSQEPRSASWRIEFQGQVYRGEGYDAEALIDTRNALGERVAPGLYGFTATETFFYDSGAQPSLRAKGTVEVRRGDIWPFGFGWMSSYDTLLVDRTDTVTIIQGDGQYLTFNRDANGAYSPPSEDFSTLVHLFDGRWLRTSPEGMQEWYSTSGRLEKLQDRNGNSQTLDYEPNGQTLAVGAWGLTDRLSRITDASGGVYQFAYGADGYVNRVTDPSGRSYQLAHDVAGNLTGITDALGRVTAYEYDADHLLMRVVYPEGDDVNLAYDDRRRLLSHQDALGGVRSIQYLKGSNVTTDERGVPTTYLFNEYGAVTQWRNPVQSVNYIWDANRLYRGTDEPYRRFVYDARGSVVEDNSYISLRTTYDPVFHQPASFTDGARNTTLYSYDNRGNRVLTTDAAGNKYRAEYDNYGQMVKATDPLNQTVTFAYDALGNVSSQTDAMGFATQFSYDARGNVTEVRDAENHNSHYTFDPMDRLTATTDSLGRTTKYEFDRNDNLTRVEDARGKVTALAYDDLNRVTSETDPLGNVAHFSYDAGGNLTTSLDAKGGSATYTRDAGNRLTEEVYSGGGGVTYTYNSINDLTGYQDGETRATNVYSSAIPHHPDLVSTELLTPGISTNVSYDYVVAVNAAAAEDGGRGTEDGGQGTEDGGQRTEDGGQGQAGMEASMATGATGQPEGESTATSVPTPQPDTSSEPIIMQQPEADFPLPSEQMPSDASPTPEGSEAPGRPMELQPYSAESTGVATNVCGGIAANTTWTLANSPYVVTCDVGVPQGLVLTIQPGVVVKFNDYYSTIWVEGRLAADGTEAQPITFTSLKDDAVGGDTNGDGGASQPGPNDWDSLRFLATSTGSVLDHAIVRYGGGDWYESVYVATPDITLTNNTIASSGEAGIRFDNVLPASLTGNHFVNNVSFPAWAPLSNNSQSIVLSGNTASGNKVNGFLVTGNIGGNVTWDGDDGFPFLVSGDLAINQGARLTLAPSTVVKFNDYYSTLWINGTLIASTDAGGSIVFTSFKDDAVGGDTNGDGGASQPGPNDWDSLRFLATSTGSVLDHAIIRYGGGDWYESVYVATPDITLTNNTIASSGEAGIRFDNVLPASLTGNHFVDNVGFPAWAPLSNNGQSIVLSGNTASGNKVNGFLVTGNIGGNVTWDGDDGFPFLVSGDLAINQGARLTLAPSTVVKFNDYYSTLWINGTLIASSDAGGSIVFTSFKDDAVGGDTNGDGGASQPGPNDWDSLRFLATSTGSVLDHAIIRYGGGDWYESVYVSTPDITIANSSILHSGESGIRFDGASPTLTGNTIRDNIVGVLAQNGARPVLHENNILRNRDYGLWNQSSQVIDAEDNWWGSVKGPYDPSDDTASGGLSNPKGDGDKVSDKVDYEPWLAFSGLLYGLTIATGNNPVQNSRYGYDVLNRMTSLAASGPVNASYQYGFDAASRLTSSGPTSGPGVRTSLEYDRNSRLSQLTNRNPSGSVTFNDIRHTYDKVGNLLSAQEASGTTTYSYDASYQLMGVNGPGLTETYGYDAAGNRTSRNGVTSTYDAANQLVASSDGWTYTYDANGNLRTRTKAGQTMTYTWDVRDRLTRIDYTDGSFSAFAYDAQGRRISRRDRQGATTYFIYEGWNVVQEATPSGAVTANYIYDGPDHLLAMNRGGATYFFLYDRLGSVIGLSNGAGVLVASYRYDPWGNILATGGSTPNLANPFHFVGREWDGDSGLYYLRGRYYDPQLGRFISRDPLHLGKPDANQYAYVSNNPANATDPMGLDRRWWQALGGVAVGVGVGIGVTLTAPFSLTGFALAGAAVAAGGLAGGGAAVVSERLLAEECERNYWEAFKAGGKGGLVGGAIGFNVAWLYEAELVAGINSVTNPLLANSARTVAQQRLTLELQMSAARRMMTQAVARQDWLLYERWQAKMELLQAAMSKLPIW